MQIQAVVESLNRDRDRRLNIERQLTEASVPIAESGPPPVVTDGDGQVHARTAAQQLELARSQLKLLEARLKPGHPDIGLAKRRIRDLEQKVEAEALAGPVTAPPSAAELARQQRVAGLRAELEQLDRQIAQKVEAEKNFGPYPRPIRRGRRQHPRARPSWSNSLEITRRCSCRPRTS